MSIELQRLRDWQLERAAKASQANLSVIVLSSRGVVATLQVIDSIVRSAVDAVPEFIVLQRGDDDVTALALADVPGVEVISSSAEVSLVAVASQAYTQASAEDFLFVEDNVLFLAGAVDRIKSALGSATMAGVQVLHPTDKRIISYGGRLDPFGAFRYNKKDGAFGQGVCRNLRYPHFCPIAFSINRAAMVAKGGFCDTLRTLEVAGAKLASRLLVDDERVVIPEGAGVIIMPAFANDPREDEVLAADWETFLSEPGLDRTLRRLSCWAPPSNEYARPALLYVDEVTPEPDHNSGSLDAVNLMRILIEVGFDVIFAPNSDYAYEPHYMEELKAQGVRVLHAPDYRCTLDVLRDLGPELAAVVFCRASIMARYMGPCRFFAPQAKLIFNTVDLHHLRMERAAAVNKSEAQLRAAMVMKNFELAGVREADATIVLSEYERTLLNREISDQSVKIHCVPLIRDVPDALDARGFADREGIVFVGTYQHPPNVDAAIFLAREVWPLVRPRLPENANLMLVGSSLTPEVMELQGNGVDVVGFVKDFDSVLNRVKLSVAPLRFGAGLKGKVASALQAGLPTVATPIAIEGTNLVDGEEIVVADGAEAFADAVVRLYHDEAMWQRISEAGYRHAKRTYSCEVNQVRIQALFDDVGLAVGATGAVHERSIVVDEDQP